MKLIPNASDWHKLWSVRLIILSAILSGVEIVLPYWSDAFPPHLFAILASVVSLAAAVARIVKQRNIGDS